MKRSVEEEKRFLRNLITYKGLEEKYYPNSYRKSSLSLEDFKLHTSNIEALFIKAIQPAKYGNLGEWGRREIDAHKLDDLKAALKDYRYFFKNLVEGHKFKECFSKELLSSLISHLTKLQQDYGYAEAMLLRFKKWGLIEDPALLRSLSTY